jgi:hypothetical protein
MHLDLSDEETAALSQELHDIVEGDRYPFLAAYPHPEGDPKLDPPARAAAGTAATAECRRRC